MRNLLYMSQEGSNNSNPSHLPTPYNPTTTRPRSSVPPITTAPKEMCERPMSAASSSGQSEYMTPTGGDSDCSATPHNHHFSTNLTYNSALPIPGSEIPMNSVLPPSIPMMRSSGVAVPVQNSTSSLCDWLDMEWGK